MSSRGPHPTRWLVVPAGLFLLAGSLAARDPRSSLGMAQGRVVAVAEARGEGALPLVTVTLASPADGSRSWELLLAPRTALADIGFEVEVGDHLKARIFPAAEGPAKVHKVMNLTRRKMVRIRTLSQIPLWDGNGAWQGGQCGGLPLARGEAGRRDEDGT